MTQAELANAGKVTPAYLWRLESGTVTPGIDLVARLAGAPHTTVEQLVPLNPPDSLEELQNRARELFERLLGVADQPTLEMLCPLSARVGEGQGRKRS
jgi:transcriptional regulator with XRE-family HTH domain